MEIKLKRNSSSINSDEIILDIGPKKTIDQIKKETIENSMTVLWNGPLVTLKIKNSQRTNEIAKKYRPIQRENLLFSILGGGDTISAIKKKKC